MDHRIIPVADRFEDVAPYSRPSEDRFGQHRAAEQSARLDADHRQHGDKRIFERVPIHDRELRQSLGPRRAHVIELHHFQHAGTRHAGDDRHRNSPERDRRQDQVLEYRPQLRELSLNDRVEHVEPGHRVERIARVHPPARRQPMQLVGEDPLLHQAEPEDRHRHAEQRDQHADIVEPRIMLPGADDARVNAEKHREQHAGNRKLECRGQIRHDLFRDRRACSNRIAEISREQISKITEILLKPGLVQSELVSQRLLGLLGRFFAQDRIGRIARNRVNDRKDNDRHAQQYRNQYGQPFEYVGSHCASPAVGLV